MLHRITTTLGCSLVLGLVVFGAQPAGATSIVSARVSVSSSGAQANGASCCGVVSGGGQFVAFDSFASNLSIHSDTNGTRDVFVRDRVAGTTRRVSVSSLGAQSNGPSWVDAISADGRYVVFRSAATDLVHHDTNHHVDVFVRDLATGRTTRVSDTPSGVQGTTDAGRASISANARFVIFREAYGTACGTYGVFVKDRSAHTLKLVSRNSNGSPMCRFPTPCGALGRVTGGHVTNNGHIVTFELHSADSDCTPHPDAVVRDRAAGQTHVFDGYTVEQDISPDGRFVAYTDGFGGRDVFLRDRVAKTTIEVTGSPTQPPSGISALGNRVRRRRAGRLRLYSPRPDRRGHQRSRRRLPARRRGRHHGSAQRHADRRSADSAERGRRHLRRWSLRRLRHPRRPHHPRRYEQTP